MAEITRFSEKIGFIGGGGNMATAIGEGIIRKNLVQYSQIYVSGPNLKNLENWRKYGANATTDNSVLVKECDVIFIAVKPHFFDDVVEQLTLKGANGSNKLFVSIMAGIKLEQLENKLKKIGSPRIIRVMPNTPMLIGEGCTVFSPAKSATENDINIVKTILEISGKCKRVSENLINPFGALSGSGPAFVYLMLEAMADGGVKIGIPREAAVEFAAQTMIGAAKMVLSTGKHTGILKDEVCSPGGTTIAGVYALEECGVRAGIMKAIEKAKERSDEISKSS